MIQVKKALILLMAGVLLNGCYTYSQQDEKEADFSFSQVGRQLNEAKAEENLTRARRDKFLKDSNFEAATHENEILARNQNSVRAIQGRYDVAKKKSLETREGSIKPSSPMMSFLKLFKRNDENE